MSQFEPINSTTLCCLPKSFHSKSYSQTSCDLLTIYDFNTTFHKILSNKLLPSGRSQKFNSGSFLLAGKNTKTWRHNRSFSRWNIYIPIFLPPGCILFLVLFNFCLKVFVAVNFICTFEPISIRNWNTSLLNFLSSASENASLSNGALTIFNQNFQAKQTFLCN